MIWSQMKLLGKSHEHGSSVSKGTQAELYEIISRGTSVSFLEEFQRNSGKTENCSEGKDFILKNPVRFPKSIPQKAVEKFLEKSLKEVREQLLVDLLMELPKETPGGFPEGPSFKTSKET